MRRGPRPVELCRERGATSLALVFAITAALMTCAIVLIVRWRAEAPPHAPPDVADPEQPIAGWRGERELLVASLSPLYADAGRQRFEGEVLRERLKLAPGEAWRLSLELGEGGAVELGQLAVRDERGEALRALQLEPTAGDPVRTLLAPPRGELAGGSSAHCVLWGRAPGAGAELTGVGRDGIALAPHALRRIELNQPLARVGGEAGKKPAGGASDSGHGDRD